ncbi:MAG: hypothetical protein LUH05_07085 [Candidatus Gastranaerophilales bacterium]|nr:hypothetical protein [Candidatus Gastranaerophilales bacterium]
MAECGYWIENPYKGTCSATRVYNNEGTAIGWKCKETGSSLPSDYNGNFSDCQELYEFWEEVMNVQKVCDSNAYDNGCIPKYEGYDTAYQASHPDASDTDVSNAMYGCAGFKQSNILAGKAIVLADGAIIFPYSGSYARLVAVDVNGFKGPNKWGHDLHVFKPKGNLYEDSKYYPGGTCEIVEKGGKTASNLLYGN